MARRLRRLAYLLAGIAAIFYIALAWSFAPSELPWKTVAPSTIERFEGPGVQVDGRLYVFFGYAAYNQDEHLLVATDDVSSYDPASDTWQSHAPAPFAGSHLNGMYDGRHVWFAGGFEGNHPGPAVRSVWKYDPAIDTWASGPALPEPVGGGALVLVGRELHYISGYFGAMLEASTDYHWFLDLDDQAAGWRDEPPLPSSRGHAGGIAVGPYIYIIGGSLTHHPTWIDSDLVHRYDTRTNQWQRMADLPYPASHFEPGTYLQGDSIVVAGGRNGASARLSEMELHDITMYDVAADRWRVAGSLPLPLRAPVVMRIADKVIVTTGSTHWAQEPRRATYALSCVGEEIPVCNPGAGGPVVPALKTWLKSAFKRLASALPDKAQTLLALQRVAKVD